MYIRNRAGEHSRGRIKRSCVTALFELYRHVLKYVYKNSAKIAEIFFFVEIVLNKFDNKRREEIQISLHLNCRRLTNWLQTIVYTSPSPHQKNRAPFSYVHNIL